VNEHLDSSDFQAISHMSVALWPRVETSTQAAQESITASALQDLTAGRFLEKTAYSLLKRAENQQSPGQFLNHPFYRLLPLERFLLTALHMSHWSYKRLARLSGKSEEVIQSTAWKARVYLAQFKQTLALPQGSTRPGCPPFDHNAPWTQKLLDDELNTKDRTYLQNHMMACPICSEDLRRSREIYFRADAFLKDLMKDVPDGQDFEDLWRKIHQVKTRESHWTFWGSLKKFYKKRDVQVLTLVMIAIFLYKLLV